MGISPGCEPERLLINAGYEYIKMKDKDVCCGFGGTYSVDFPEVSNAILEKKIDAASESGAGIIATDCPGCVMQIHRGITARNLNVKVMHTAQALERALVN